MLHREEFLAAYQKRSNVESTFSMFKAKFRDHVRAKTDTARLNEVLCKLLAHNCCLIQSQCELGVEVAFWQNEDQPDTDEPAVLPLVRPGETAEIGAEVMDDFLVFWRTFIAYLTLLAVQLILFGVALAGWLTAVREGGRRSPERARTE